MGSRASFGLLEKDRRCRHFNGPDGRRSVLLVQHRPLAVAGVEASE